MEKDRLLFNSSSSSVICHVVGITYQTIEHRLLAEMLGDPLGKNPNPSLEKQTYQRAQWNLKYSALLYVGLSVSVTQQKLHTLEKMIWFHFKAPLINISILFEWNANEAPPLFVQTRRWRFGWISTAGRRTRKDKSLSSTRRRVSSPRTSWRRSTLRVSADKNWQKLQY